MTEHWNIQPPGTDLPFFARRVIGISPCGRRHDWKPFEHPGWATMFFGSPVDYQRCANCYLIRVRLDGYTVGYTELDDVKPVIEPRPKRLPRRRPLPRRRLW